MYISLVFVVQLLSHVQFFCHPMDCSLSGSSVHGVLQARTLGLVAISFSRGSSQTRDQSRISCIAGGLFTAEPSEKPHASLTLSQRYDGTRIDWKKSILNFNKHRFSAYNTPNTLLGTKEIEVNKAETLSSSNPVLKIVHLSGRINAILLSINIQQE